MRKHLNIVHGPQEILNKCWSLSSLWFLLQFLFNDHTDFFGVQFYTFSNMYRSVCPKQDTQQWHHQKVPLRCSLKVRVSPQPYAGKHRSVLPHTALSFENVTYIEPSRASLLSLSIRPLRYTHVIPFINSSFPFIAE